MNGRNAKNELRFGLKAETDTDIRYCFVEILNGLLEYDERLIAVMLPYLLDGNVKIRRKVCYMMAKLHENRATPYLVTLLEDGDYEVGLMARRALNSINTAESNFALYEWGKRLK